MEMKELNENAHISFAEKVIAKVRSILDKYMEGFQGYDELKDFMDNEENLYGPDGKPTEEYKKKITEVENYVVNNSIDNAIKDSCAQSEEDHGILDGIIEFIDKRKEVIFKYSQSEKELGEDFNAESFINKLINDSPSEDEKKQIINMMETLAEQDALGALDEETVWEGFKEVINFKGK
mgnify:CR=1 FL=1